jgi:hypothetical protein
MQRLVHAYPVFTHERLGFIGHDGLVIPEARVVDYILEDFRLGFRFCVGGRVATAAMALPAKR